MTHLSFLLLLAGFAVLIAAAGGTSCASIAGAGVPGADGQRRVRPAARRVRDQGRPGAAARLAAARAPGGAQPRVGGDERGDGEDGRLRRPAGRPAAAARRARAGGRSLLVVLGAGVGALRDPAGLGRSRPQAAAGLLDHRERRPDPHRDRRRRCCCATPARPASADVAAGRRSARWSSATPRSRPSCSSAPASVLHATGERDLDRLGGLAARMPVTAAAFGVGALGAAALPVTSGFVAEWVLLQALIHGDAPCRPAARRRAADHGGRRRAHRRARPAHLRQGLRDRLPGPAALRGGRGTRHEAGPAMRVGDACSAPSPWSASAWCPGRWRRRWPGRSAAAGVDVGRRRRRRRSPRSACSCDPVALTLLAARGARPAAGGERRPRRGGTPRRDVDLAWGCGGEPGQPADAVHRHLATPSRWCGCSTTSLQAAPATSRSPTPTSPATWSSEMPFRQRDRRRRRGPALPPGRPLGSDASATCARTDPERQHPPLPRLLVRRAARSSCWW